jgi:two-component sensor histidine kinase
MSLRFRLSVLVGVAIMPPLLLTGYNTTRWQEVLEREARDQALTSARLIGAELAQVIEGSRQLLIALGNHPAVPDRESECVAYFKSVIEQIPIYREAAVIDKDGRFRCSTIPIPSTLNVRDRLYFYEPQQTGRMTVGTLVQGRVTHAPSLHVSAPYRKQDGSFEGVIVVILNPERLAQELASRPWRSDQLVLVLDREGSLVLSLPPGRSEEAKVLAQQVFAAAHPATPGVLSATDGRGRGYIVGYSPLAETPAGLLVANATDREQALTEVRQATTRSVVFGLLAVLVAVAGAWLVIHLLIRRPVLAMVEAARSREADIKKPFPALRPSSELGELSTALSRMSSHIDQLLDQKTFLLRELQHRVMNSLTLLTSVLRMQNRLITDPRVKDQLGRAEARVYSMAAVYRHLYQEETAESVDFGELLRTICQETQRAYTGTYRASINVTADPLMVSMSNATSLAMLVNELITNALKHAYPDGGPISISLRRIADGAIELRVADRGRGLPEDFAAGESASLGMKIITGTAQQLRGVFEINRLEPGTEFVIRFPADMAKDPKRPE